MKSFHEQMADKMGADDGEAPSESDSPDYGAGYKTAIKAMMDAFHSKDVDALADAFKTASSLCEKAEGDDEGDGAGDLPEPPSGHAAMLLIPHGKH